MKKFLRIFFRVAPPLLTLACLFFIFSNSAQSAVQSSGQSGRLASFLSEVLGKLFGEILPPERINSVIRKLAHAAEFALYAFLLSASVIQKRKTAKGFAPEILGTALFVAVTDEYLQSYFAGRSPEVADVVIDFSGAIVGFGLALVLGRLILRRRSFLK